MRRRTLRIGRIEGAGGSRSHQDPAHPPLPRWRHRASKSSFTFPGEVANSDAWHTLNDEERALVFNFAIEPPFLGSDQFQVP